MIVCCVWLSIGMAIDAWAHRNVPDLESFFTPWHAVFYSGFGAVAAHVLLTTRRQVRNGYPWRRAAPEGYAEALVGLAIFAAGGIGDALWHELFGVEKDLAALLSPTHLLLFTGVTLFVTSPLRSAWRRPEFLAPTASELAPAVLSVVLAITMFSFITQGLSPFVEPLAGRAHLGPIAGAVEPRLAYVGQTLGVGGILAQTVLLVGAALLLLRRWRLPFGTVTSIVVLNASIQVAVSELYALVIVAAAAGLSADLLLRRPRSAAYPIRCVRAVAVAFPLVLWGLYMGAIGLGLAGGLAWDLELWAGAVLAAGATGLLLSYLAFPPGATLARLGSHG
jgi:hypothetical protein